MSVFTIRKADDGIRWPAMLLCKGRRASEDESDCLCRLYDECAGYYVIEGTGHACAYFLQKKDALGYVAFVAPKEPSGGISTANVGGRSPGAAEPADSPSAAAGATGAPGPAAGAEVPPSSLFPPSDGCP